MKLVLIVCSLLICGLANAAQFEGTFQVKNQSCSYNSSQISCGDMNSDQMDVVWNQTSKVIQVHWLKKGKEIFRNDLFNFSRVSNDFVDSQVLKVSPDGLGFECQLTSASGWWVRAVTYKFESIGNNQFKYTQLDTSASPNRAEKIEFVLEK